MASDLSVRVVALADTSGPAATKFNESLQELIDKKEFKVDKVRIASFDMKAAITDLKKDLMGQLSEITITTKISEKELSKTVTVNTTAAQKSIKALESEFDNLISKNQGASEAVKGLKTELDKIKVNPDIQTQKTDFEALSQTIKDTQSNLNDLEKAQTAMSGKQVGIDVDTINTDIANLTARLQKLTVPEQVAERLSTIKELANTITLEGFRNETVDDQLAVFKQYNDELQRIRNSTALLEKQKGFDAQNNQLIRLDQSLEKYLKTYSKISASEYANEFTKLQTAIKGAITSEDLSQTANLSAEFNRLDAAVTLAGLKTQTFGDKLSQVAAKYGIFLSLGAIIRQTVATIKDMVSAVIELDASMTDLAMVTGIGTQKQKEFMESAKASSREIGTTISDVIKSTSDFARLGYGLGDAEQLAKIANVYYNIAPGIQTIDDATKSIISTQKAFNMSVDESMHIVDAFNQVGKDYAISAQDIGESFLRSASALSAANNTFEESVGLTTAAFITLQNAEQAGTFLKTYSARLRNTAGELEELGEDADGAAESITQLQTQILNLTKGAVDIMDTNDTFKSTYQITKELAEVWETLDDVTQATLTRLVAGNMRVNAFSGVMMNMKDGIDATNTALNSQGSALADNEIRMESIRGKINLFNQAFESLSETMISSDLVKIFVDIGTFGIRAFEGIISIADGVPFTIIAITASLIALKAVIKTIGELTLFQNIAANFAKAKKEALALGTALKTLAASHPYLLALSVAVAAIVVAYNAFNVTLKEHKQRLADANAEYDEAKTKLESIQNELKAVNDRIGELQNKGPLTFVEEGELQSLEKITSELLLQEEIAKRMAAMRARETAQEVIGTAGATYEDLDLSQEALDWATLNTEISANSATLNDNQASMAMVIADYEKISKLRDEIYAKDTLSDDDVSKVEEYDRVLAGLEDKLLVGISSYSEWKKSVEEVPIDEQTQEMKDFISTMDEGIEVLSLFVMPEKWTELKFSEIFDAEEFKEVTDELTKLAEAGNLTFTNFHSVTTSMTGGSGFIAAMDEAGFSVVECLNQIIALNNNKVELDSDEAEKFTKSIDKTRSNIEMLIKAQQEQNNEGEISQETYIKISKAGKEYADLLTYENGQYKLVSGSIKDFIRTLMQKLIQSSVDIKMTEEQGQALEDLSLIAYDVSLAYDTLGDSIGDISDAYKTVESAQKEYKDTGELTASTVAELIALDSQYLQYLVDENGQLNLNAESLNNVSNAMRQQMIETVQAGVASEILSIILADTTEKTDDLGAQAETTQAKLAAIGAEALETSKDLGVMGVAALIANKALADEEVDVEGLSQTALDAIENALKTGRARLDAIGLMGDKVASKSKASAKKEKDTWKEAFEAQQKDLEYALNKREITEEEYFTRLGELNEKYFANNEKYIDEYRKYELEVLNGLQGVREKNHEDLISSFEKSIDALEKYIAQVAEGTAKDLSLDAITKEVELIDEMIAQLGDTMVTEFNRGSQAIDLLNRPMVELEDGFATILSTSFGVDGKEILVTPVLPNGEILSNEELENYLFDLLAQGDIALETSPIYLGTFEDIEAANEYGESLHNIQEQYYDLIRRKQELANIPITISSEELSTMEAISQIEQLRSQQITIYEDMQEELHRMANYYRDLNYAEDSDQIVKLQERYIELNETIRDANKQTLSDIVTVFNRAIADIDKSMADVDFKISITADDDFSTQSTLINQKIEIQMGLVKELTRDINYLQLTTDDATKATAEYKDEIADYNTQMQAAITNIYDLINAQRDAATKEIEQVRDLQNKIIQTLEARYKKELELFEKTQDAKEKALDKELELLKEQKDASVDSIDAQLDAWKALWKAQDAEKKKKDLQGEIDDLQARINELLIAA